MTSSLQDALRAAAGHSGHGWSMGSFGAICEFHHVAGDPAPDMLECGVLTGRGGLRFDDLTGLVPVAWEATSPRTHRWQQGVSLCLPEAGATMSVRDVLTEIGPDDGALRDSDRGAILFDLGLAQPQVDYCVRTADPDLIAFLRGECGRAVFDPESKAMSAILPAHPNRISITRIGRLEVFQKIGGPDTGGVSPVGPHTHLLPKLLRAGRTHSANTPIPPGLIPVAGLHPASPVMDSLGQDRDFDLHDFAMFQAMLAVWGDPERHARKSDIWARLAAGTGPDGFDEPEGRHDRATLRVALRQYERQHGPNAASAEWRARFDRETAADDEDAPGH